jgi:hypothetical protein
VTPPEHVVRRAHELVGQLSAESYLDREAATRELETMDPSLVALLSEYAQHTDPEVRHRVQRVIAKLREQRPDKVASDPIYPREEADAPF